MASRQRSFFDQNPSKPRQWYKRRPFPNQHTSDQHLPKPAPPPAPPICASSASRNKLKAFQYTSSKKESSLSMLGLGISEADKENARSWQEDGIKTGSKHASQKSLGPREYPRTPIARVPFADLVNNGEEPQHRSPLCTPADGVTWDQSPRSSDPQYGSKNNSGPSSQSPPRMKATPRGKKRARSSSPPSTQNLSQSRAKQPAFDLQNLEVSISQTDPALNLETRYFGTGMLQTPSKPPATITNQFIHSSSPQTPAIRSDTEARLRRTMSCGVAYPNSRAKRRRHSRGKTEPEDTSPVSYLPSKVTMALDDIGDPERFSQQHDVSLQPPMSQHPSSSSPFPERAERAVDTKAPISQPLYNTQRGNPSFDVQSTLPLKQHHAPSFDLDRPRSKSRQHLQRQASSSDFGEDDDMDLAFINALDASLTQRSGAATPKEVRPSTQVSAIRHQVNQLDKTLVFSQQVAVCVDLPPIMKTDNDEPDEFDDENDDLVADLEDLAAMYDKQPMTRQPRETLVATTSIRREAKEQVQAILPSPKAKPLVIDVSSDDDFGGNEFDDIAEEFDILTQAASKGVSSKPKDPSVIPRYLIKGIYDSKYTSKAGRKSPEKMLQVEECSTKGIKLVALRESWWDTNCTVGAYVHVLGDFDNKALCVIDNTRGLLIIHPDYLLSATVIADAFKCTRRAVLQARVKATNEVNESQVYGHILHEIFQEAVLANRWDTEWFQTTCQNVASRYLESLFELNLQVGLAVQHLMDKVPTLQSWAKLFVSSKLNPGATIQGPNDTTTPTAIKKLLDVEEHVWSPKYGLKGNVDATLQVMIHDDQGNKHLTVPFELKTGRKKEKEVNMSHNSQTALYNLLLSDRYDVDIAFGILYYLETSEMIQITNLRHEISGMIQRRNELACFVRNKEQLPPMLKNQHTCNYCYAKTSCFVYHKLVENGDGKTSGLGQKFTEAVEHLNPVHAEFFNKWDILLTKEEGDVIKFRKELWTMTSAEREKVGRCFGKIVIKPGSSSENTAASKINRFHYTFTKPESKPGFSFAESQINIGEPIVISDEVGHYALANGYVTKIRRSEITVAVDRRLHNARVRRKNFDAERNQDFTGIMEVIENGGIPSSAAPVSSQDTVFYRLDKDEFSNGMATVRNNLIRVMERDLFGAQFLRRLVIEHVSPTFIAPPKGLDEVVSASQASLNVDQRNAIKKVMSAQDYALVLGMPGTGKTTTIAHIIRALTAQGKSILLTSYTHTAVDNILLKIRGDKLSILRIGAEAKIHPEVKEFADLACLPKSTFEDIEKSYRSQVVATTCLGINHPVFNQRTFDYCIVDEASQITLPVCLGPIRMAHCFVLVGDHFQLPPLVQNKQAQEGGLDISLFKLLSDKHPESVVNLEHQYRMNADIMSLSNTLIYSGHLKCGTSAVASRSITIPNMAGLKEHHYTSSTIGPSQTTICPGSIPGACWLTDVLTPSKHAIFINTDLLKGVAREIAQGSRVTNPLEVALVTQIVQSFLAVGIAPTEIGVITLYRSQLTLLKQSMRAHTASGGATSNVASAVEMHTADKFQGRDKEVVVLSLVRSNETGNVGDLLQDWRRVNVALTRSRTKLIVIGSWGTISKGNELLRNMCDLMEGRGWRMDLKPKAMEEHLFDEWTTQGSTRQQDSVSPGKSKGKVQKMKVPGKVGRAMDKEALLKGRPILRDIVNDVC